MTYHLFLDDERLPHQVTWVKIPDTPWAIARDFYEFTTSIQEYGVPKYVTFDHDLGEGPTGFDCVRWLVDYCHDNALTFPDFNIHSMNNVGKDKMLAYIHNAYKVSFIS